MHKWLLFSRVTALGQLRRDLPIEAWCAARVSSAVWRALLALVVVTPLLLDHDPVPVP
jgi:hypothetical protein